MKELANLKGVKTLSRMEQKTINGGDPPCSEWCFDEDLQEHFPLAECYCGSGGSGGSGGGGPL